MTPFEEAQEKILALVSIGRAENVALKEADGRVLKEALSSKISSPPFAASAMDGYAIRRDDLRNRHRLKIIGQSKAGAGFHDALSAGAAVRIFTGAPVPKDADMILIQENTQQIDGEIDIRVEDQTESYIRAKGGDFDQSLTLRAGTKLNAALISQIAAMGHAEIIAYRKPEIAIISTGDELTQPGTRLKDDQIYASNHLGLNALFSAEGANCRLLPIAGDTRESLIAAFERAKSADLIVTTGGASVGDHDIVLSVAKEMGLQVAFHKISMRPGKPVIAGKFEKASFVGLPGNPVSALICGIILVLPALRKMQGLSGARLKPRQAILTHDLKENGPRTHFMRANFDIERNEITVSERQDSSLIHVLTQSNALVIRSVNAPKTAKGASVSYIPLPWG